jgi:hypothetical protein
MSSATMIETDKIGQIRSKPGISTVPRCAMKVEKCREGMKITCTCEDVQSAATLQEICKALTGGKLGFCCTANGTVVCQCNFCTCECNCAETPNGVCFTCTSGDKNCCAMIEACCNCVCACMKTGCDCCVCLDDTTVCCCTPF